MYLHIKFHIPLRKQLIFDNMTVTVFSLIVHYVNHIKCNSD